MLTGRSCGATSLILEKMAELMTGLFEVVATKFIFSLLLHKLTEVVLVSVGPPWVLVVVVVDCNEIDGELNHPLR